MLINLGVAIIFSILCSISFSLFWFERIKKNISIRRALGANKRDIFNFVFRKLINMLIISTIISLIVVYILIDIFKYLVAFDLTLNIFSCICSILAVSVLIILLTLVSLRKFSKIEISNLLRS